MQRGSSLPNGADYFVNDMTREDAEAYLENTPVGTALVRKTSIVKQQSVHDARLTRLAVKAPVGIEHFVIYVIEQGRDVGIFYIEDSVQFHSLEQLLDYYSRNSLPIDGTLMVTQGIRTVQSLPQQQQQQRAAQPVPQSQGQSPMLQQSFQQVPSRTPYVAVQVWLGLVVAAMLVFCPQVCWYTWGPLL
eukprot:m.82832 g.82832  ORF g.82832 m.82832 type:complete len:189 (+) comp12704_c1_seq1:293-859(+)